MVAALHGDIFHKGTIHFRETIMARWDKKDQHRDEDYPRPAETVESVVLVESTVQPPPPNVLIVKVGDKVGDIVIKHIYGKHPAFYDSATQRLMLANGTELDAYHKDLGTDVFLSFGNGTPKVVGFNKTAFKAGRYELL